MNQIINSYPNILIISGCGRNIGKTLLSCKLISKFSNLKVVAIKISPHFHDLDDDENLIHNLPECQIIEESKPARNKDSSRMLAAGADKVYYIQTIDSKLSLVEELILSQIPSDVPVICEAGGLLNYIVPGLSFFITTDMKMDEPNNGTSIKIKSEDGMPIFDIDRITFIENSWHLV